jgi:predicted nucleic acid-binding protein
LQVSLWDALIVHAARSGGAVLVYSEDLQPGAILGGVRVVNPFVTGIGRDTF